MKTETEFLREKCLELEAEAHMQKQCSETNYQSAIKFQAEAAKLREALGIDCAEGYSHPNFVAALCAALAARTGDPAANAEVVKLAAEFIAARGHRGVAYAQATSLIWAMGFDPKAADEGPYFVADAGGDTLDCRLRISD